MQFLNDLHIWDLSLRLKNNSAAMYELFFHQKLSTHSGTVKP